jgi:hypothetical protein
MVEGNYRVACEKFRESDTLDPAPGTKLNLGECEAKQGRIATAWRLLLAVEQQLVSTDVRLPLAREKRMALEIRLPKLLVELHSSVPTGTRVSVGDEWLPPNTIGQATAFDPGVVQVLAVTPDGSQLRQSVTLTEGAVTRVQFALEAPQQRETPKRIATLQRKPREVAPRLYPATEQNSEHSESLLGPVALGVGIGALTVSGVLGALTLSAKRSNSSHCDVPSQTCDAIGRDSAERGKLYGTLTTASALVGATGVGIGLYLVSTSTSKPRHNGAFLLESGVQSAKLSYLRRF